MRRKFAKRILAVLELAYAGVSRRIDPEYEI
jgi:hypothetical protein